MRLPPSSLTPLGLTLLSGLALGAPVQETGQQADDVLRDAVVQGPWREVPLGEVDDAVPPVSSDLLLPGTDRDERVAGAPQDPFFLGFAAGAHHPPAGERVDPELAALAAGARVDGRPDDVVYAFVMFSRRITPARIAELEALGLRDLGFHPHHTRKVALPVDAIDAVAALPFVRWVGLARGWQKVHPALASALDRAAPGARLDVWVSVFESDLNADSDPTPELEPELFDPNGAVSRPRNQAPREIARTHGWQERALGELGLEPGQYLENSRSFHARVDAGRLQELVRLDFVQFVSPYVEGQVLHDESVPMVGADASRATYDGAFDSAVVVAVIDSGITISHSAFSGKSASGYDFTSDDWTSFNDEKGHGTHVAATVCGNGSVEDSWAGVAPGLGTYGPSGRLVNYKIIDANGSTAGVDWDLLFTKMSADFPSSPKPQVLNHSWGYAPPAGGWFGTEPQAVDFDDAIYENRQLHVFSSGNWGPGSSTVSQQGSTKNGLTVGAVLDHYDNTDGPAGNIWGDSSRGPVADGRWKPSVVAPGSSIKSAEPETVSGYVSWSGTSMAAPHVTGVAAQLLDHYEFLRTRPATTTALLMATATTLNDVALGNPSNSHFDIFGAGRVNAERAHFATSQQDLYFWAWSSADGSATIEVDIPMDASTTRLTAAMVYHEEGASVGASQALVNDWDMWIDVAPFEAGGNSGEFFAHQSLLDNVELRMVDNPGPNTYRIKLYPKNVSSTCRMGLAVSVVHGDTEPDGTLSVTADEAFAQPGEGITFTASAFNPSFWASAVFFNSSATIGSTLESSTAVLKDGTTASFLDNEHGGRDVLVGNIRHGQSRSVEWTAHWNSEGTKTWQVDALSDNWVDKTAQVQVVVDGTDPNLPAQLASSSHTPMTWSNDPEVDFTWTAATDALSGLDGYSYLVTNSPTQAPLAFKNLEEVKGLTATVPTSTQPWFLKLRAVDHAGNWTDGYAASPGYLIDTVDPSAATGFDSTSHTPGVTTCSNEVVVTWGAAADTHSGLGGYLLVWNHLPFTVPLTGPQLPAGSVSANQVLSDGTWYAHLRPFDVAGNLGPASHAGPFVIDQQQYTTYCTSKVTSSLCTPAVTATGPVNYTDPTAFRVTGTQLQHQQNGIGFFGLSGPNAAPFQGGFLCVMAPVYRLPLQNTGGAGDCQGVMQYTLADLLAHPSGGALIDAGSQVYMQFWFRDTLASFGSGLSDAIEFLVCK